MLIDANLLLYAVDETSRFHQPASRWLTAQLNGPRRVGFPWPSLQAFMRIVTNPRASSRPLNAADAWGFVQDWLVPEIAWIPVPGQGHLEIFGSLVVSYDLRGNLVADAHVAALAIEHGLVVCSADTDFARFGEIRWFNPLAEG